MEHSHDSDAAGDAEHDGDDSALDARVSFPARRVLRNRLLLAMAASPLLLYVPLAVLAATGHLATALLLTLHPLLLAGASVFAVAKRNPRPRFAHGEIRVTLDHVELPGGVLVERRVLTQGFVTKRPDGLARVVLFGPRIPLELVVDTEEEGRRLLGALQLDATQTAATFVGQSRIATAPLGWRIAGALALWAPSFILLLSAISVSSLPLVLTLLFAGAAMIFAPLLPILVLTRPSNVSVGLDGIDTVWLGRRRFIPFSRVCTVELLPGELGGKVDRGVALILDSGARVLLPLTLRSLVDGEAARLLSRIEQALHARGAGKRGAATLLASVIDAKARVLSLRRLGAGAVAGPRTPATDSEALVATLEDPSAPSAARASAAIALSATADAADRERIRAAARQVASPRLRVALERAASADVDDAALAEALAAVADEDEGAARPRRVLER